MEESVFKEMIAKNFPNLGKDVNIHVQEDQGSLVRLDSNKTIWGHITIKLSNIKDKERILKATTKKEQTTYKEIPIRQKFYRSEEGGMIYSKYWENFIQKMCPSEMQRDKDFATQFQLDKRNKLKTSIVHYGDYS